MSRAPNKAAARVGARAFAGTVQRAAVTPGQGPATATPRAPCAAILLMPPVTAWQAIGLLHDEVRRGPPSRASFSFAALEAVVFFTVPS